MDTKVVILTAFMVGATVLGLLTAESGAARAQTAPPISSRIAPPGTLPTAIDLNPGAQIAPRKSTRTDVFSPPEPGPCPFVRSELVFRLEGVDIVGATRLAEKDEAEATAGLTGRDIPVSSICEIRDRLSRALFRRGVLARVEVPEQVINQGRLKLLVVEARIVSVRVHGDIGPVQAKVEAYLDHLRNQTPFDLDAAQRYLLLTNDIPGVHATAVLRASTHVAKDAQQGAIDLDVTVTRVASDNVVAVQNTGSETVGPWSEVGRLDFNSATRFGERTTLIAYATSDFREQLVAQGVEQFRLGANGLFGQVSAVYGVSHPGGSLEPLKLDNQSFVGTAELDYPLVRLERESLSLGAGLDVVNQTTTFPTGATLTNDSLRILWIKSDMTGVLPVSPDLLLKGAGTISLRKGILALGASPHGAIDLSRSEGLSDAMDGRIEADVHAVIRHALDLSAHVQAQYAAKPLLAYEQLEVGSLTIGRGYDPAAASGDLGMATEFKAQYDAIHLWRWGAISPYVFYDIASIDSHDTGSQHIELHSFGGGLRAGLPYGLTADVYYAVPEDKPFPAALNKPPARLYVGVVLAH